MEQRRRRRAVCPCLTCSAYTNAYPQLVDYDSYVDIRRSLIVGGPQAKITTPCSKPSSTLEAERRQDFTPPRTTPSPQRGLHHPGCVDYLDQEMVFSHLNESTMDLGANATAFTSSKMGEDVTYLGRDFLKCCGDKV